jgi:hypothetical protein
MANRWKRYLEETKDQHRAGLLNGAIPLAATHHRINRRAVFVALAEAATIRREFVKSRHPVVRASMKLNHRELIKLAREFHERSKTNLATIRHKQMEERDRTEWSPWFNHGIES